MRLERFENTLVGGSIVRKQTPIEFLALERQIKVSATPVAANHAALNQPPFFELPDDHTRIVTINTKTRRNPDLIDPRLAVALVEIGQHAVLQRCQVCFSQGVGD